MGKAEQTNRKPGDPFPTSDGDVLVVEYHFTDGVGWRPHSIVTSDATWDAEWSKASGCLLVHNSGSGLRRGHHHVSRYMQTTPPACRIWLADCAKLGPDKARELRVAIAWQGWWMWRAFGDLRDTIDDLNGEAKDYGGEGLEPALLWLGTLDKGPDLADARSKTVDMITASIRNPRDRIVTLDPRDSSTGHRQFIGRSKHAPMAIQDRKGATVFSRTDVEDLVAKLRKTSGGAHWRVAAADAELSDRGGTPCEG